MNWLSRPAGMVSRRNRRNKSFATPSGFRIEPLEVRCLLSASPVKPEVAAQAAPEYVPGEILVGPCAAESDPAWSAVWSGAGSPSIAPVSRPVRMEALGAWGGSITSSVFEANDVGRPAAGPTAHSGGLAAFSPVVGPNVAVNNPVADLGSSDTQSETTLIVFGDTVLVGYNDSGSFNSGAHFTGYARSTDGGASFTDLGILPDSAAGDAGDPVLARDSVTGRIYLATLGFNNNEVLQVFRSDDDGSTFGAPVNATPGFDGTADFQDKEWITVDNAPGAGQGNVYLVWRNFANGPNGGIRFTRSVDGGSTWTPNGGLLIASEGGVNVQGPFVATGPDHTIYVAWYDATGGTPAIKIRKSTDQGVSFDAPVTVAALNTLGTNGDLGLGFRSNAFPSMAVNPVNGHLYITYTDDPAGGDRADVYFTESSNGGATWSAPLRVNDDATTNDQYQPAIAVTPDGSRVFIGFYDRRLDPSNVLIDTFGVIGSSAGATVVWDTNFRISNTSFEPVYGVDPFINPVYMGDYDQAAADNNAFYYTWGDNRNDSLGRPGKQADVRLARLDLSLAVSSTVPVVGSVVTAPPTSFVVNFNAPIQSGSVQASDLNVNGIAATSRVVNDADTVTFSYATSPVTNQGLQMMTMAENSVFRQSDGDGLAAFSGEFRYDVAPMHVVATLPPEGSVIPGPNMNLRLDLNENFLPGTEGIDDLVLSQGFVTAAGPVDGNTVEYLLAGLETEAALSVELPAGSLTDGFGNPSLAFSAQFIVDIGVKSAAAFERLQPLGSLGFLSADNEGVVSFNNDSDAFQFFAESGERVAAIVTPLDASLVLSANVDGGANATATGPGLPVVVPVTAISSTGLHQVRVSSAATGTGSSRYRLDIYRNVALEAQVGDSANGRELAVDNSFISIGSGRWAVAGTATLGSSVEYLQDFNAGASDWVIDNTYATGSGLWHASTGRAADGVPNHSPPGSLYYGQGEGPTGGGNYDAGDTEGIVTSPFLRVPDLHPALQFNQFLEKEGGTNYDVAAVEIETGAGFVPLVTTANGTLAQTVGWATATADLDDYAGQVTRFRLHFDTVDAISNGFEGWYVDDVRLSQVVADLDEYTLNLTSSVGERIDIMLAGQGVNDFSGGDVVMSLLAPNGTTVLATASASPLGVDARNYDQAILGYQVVTPGVYTIRVQSARSGDYVVLATQSLAFDSEPNHDPQNPLQSLDNADGALGFLSEGDGSTGEEVLFGIDWADPTPTSILTLNPADASILNAFDSPATVTVNPYGFNLAFDGTYLWYNAGAFLGDNQVYQIDGLTGAVLNVFTASQSIAGYGLAYVDGEIFYSDSGEVDVYSAADFTYLRSFANPELVAFLEGLAGDPDGLLYGVAQQTHTLYRMDASTGVVLGSAPTSPVGFEQGLGLAGEELFVSETTGIGQLNEIAVYDKNTLELVRRMPVEVENMIAGLGGDGIAPTFPVNLSSQARSTAPQARVRSAGRPYARVASDALEVDLPDDSDAKSGHLSPSSPLPATRYPRKTTAEENGAIPFATDLGLQVGQVALVNSTIGDGLYGATSGDYDWYRIANARTGDMITIDVDAAGLGSPLDSYVGVYNAAGTLLDQNDEADGPDSFLQFVTPAAGDYFVVVRGFGSGFQSDPFNPASGGGVGSTGAYALTVGLDSTIPRLTTAEENGAIPFATSTGLTSGGAVRFISQIGDGAFGATSGDYDWYRLTSGTSGDVITIDVDAYQAGTPLDSYVGVYNAAGTLLDQNDDADGLDSFLQIVTPAAGDYFVVVRGFGSGFQSDPFNPASGGGVGSTGNYAVTIELNPQGNPALRGPRVNLIDPTGSAPYGLHDIKIEFSEPITSGSALDLNNYRLIEAGPNGVFEGGAGDDAVVLLLVALNGADRVTLSTADGTPLDAGLYQLTIEGDTSIKDLDGNPLNALAGPGSGVDEVHEFNIELPAGDRYHLSLDAGEVITLSTRTMLDESASMPLNSLDPLLILLAPDGSPVSIDSNGADGKSARLRFTAAVAGTYTVLVAAESGEGEYALLVNAEPEMDVRRNGLSIADGDSTPSVTDGTNFGTPAAGATVTRQFTILNTGTASLELPTGVQISGANALDFSVTTQPAAVIAPGGSTTFNVRFAPLASGARNATLVLANNDASEHPYDFAIQGTGSTTLTPGEIDVQGNGISITDGDSTPAVADGTDFGQSPVGTPVSRTFIVRNLGTAGLLLTGSPLFTVGGPHAVDFTVTSQPGAQIAGNGSAVVTVQFLPTAGGPRFATLSIANSDGNENPYNFSIQGNVPTNQPEIDVQRNGLSIVDGDDVPDPVDGTDFGTVVMGTSVTRQFTILNTGVVPLTLGSVADPGTDWEITQQPSASVAPGGSTTFRVRYSPTSPGVNHAVVSFSNNDDNENPYNFAIRGIGRNPAPEIEVRRLTATMNELISDGDLTPSAGDGTDFGSVAVGSSVTRQFTILNTGAGPLNVDPIADPDGAAAVWAVTQQPAAVVAPGGSTTFRVRFAPTAAASFPDTVDFSNGDPNENPYNFAITGTGTGGPTGPEIDVQRNGLSIADGDLTPSLTDGTDFGNVALGSSVTRQFTIFNTGTSTLNVGSIPDPDGAGAAWAITQQPAATVAPGSSTTFRVRFSPQALGTNSDTVDFSNNDTNENPYNFAIRGTGVSALASSEITGRSADGSQAAAVDALLGRMADGSLDQDGLASPTESRRARRGGRSAHDAVFGRWM